MKSCQKRNSYNMIRAGQDISLVNNPSYTNDGCHSTSKMSCPQSMKEHGSDSGQVSRSTRQLANNSHIPTTDAICNGFTCRMCQTHAFDVVGLTD